MNMPSTGGRPVPAARLVSLLPFAASLLAAGLRSQEASSPDPSEQEPDQNAPVVVTASRFAQDPFETPRSVDVITVHDLDRKLPRTLQQSLRDLPSVLVQETAPGQGSPFLRGFTGYHNLMLIDGIRLNNSTFRSGPNQYWSTIDPWALERIEVVRGPSSTLWGSDAIGGTVQVFTKSPTLPDSDGDALIYGGGLFGRYATAENSLQMRAEYQAARSWADGSRTAFLIGGTVRDFGEIEGGRSTGVQDNTDHSETAWDIKIEHWFDPRTRLVFLNQRLAQNEVPRTHSTQFGISYAGTSVGSDLQRDYDQVRNLTYLQLHETDMGGLLDKMILSVSYQRQDQVEDRIRSSGSQRWQGFEVGTYGVFAQFEGDAGSLGRLSYGFDYYHDEIDSFFRRSGTPQPGDEIQGPLADDASYDLFGAYVQDVVDLADGVQFQAGIRYTYAEADAGSVRDPQNSANRISLSDSWDELTASAHLRVDLAEGWNVYGGVSQGFRAPTIYDMSSFDTARSGEQEVPATNLDAEHFVGYEIGSKVRRGPIEIRGAVYYTDVSDQITRFPTGTTTGSGDPIVTKANVGDGYVQGAELQFGWNCLPGTTLYGVGSYQYGRVSNFLSGGTSRTDDYISRMMPVTNILGIRWEDDEGRLHASTEVIRAEEADKLSAGDLRDTQRIPPGGTPGYTVWNLRAGWQIDERTTLECALENVTDVDYRVHGSGSNMPGRNFVIGMRLTF